MRIYGQIMDILNRRKTVALITLIRHSADTRLIGEKIVITENEVFSSRLDEYTTQKIKVAAEAVIKSGKNALAKVNGENGDQLDLFVHLYTPPPRLIILGGGHVGGALCRMAALLDYEIILIDDRPSFSSITRHPLAHHTICDPFDRAIDHLMPSTCDYLVIVTRGHRHDRICLEKALAWQAAYIGMIGSRRRVRVQMKALEAKGYPREKLEWVHSPIGLSIGAATESEIALSILAEITQVRRSGGSAGEVVQKDVLHALTALEADNRKVLLATVVNTRGSTPGREGSQLLIYPDGSIKGSIGGGCAEAEVRREALLRLEQLQPGLMQLHLTEDAASEEGMACGGSMEIFLDPLL